MFKNNIVLIYSVAGLFLTQSSFWLIFVNFNQLPPIIPLWNLEGVSSRVFVPVQFIWLLPGLSISIIAIHLLFTALTHRRQPFLVGFVMAMTVVTSLFLFIATVVLLSRMLGWF